MREQRKLRRSILASCLLGGCGLLLGSLVFIWLNSPSQSSLNDIIDNSAQPVQELPSTRSVTTTVVDSNSIQVELQSVQVFPIGSVEEACGLHKFPTGTVEAFKEENYTPDSVEYVALENASCFEAVEGYIHSFNPYLFLWPEFMSYYAAHPLSLIVLDEPLTFERIFADPVGDLHLVQDALSRPECVLPPSKTNWDLKDSCHAKALTNLALINRLCYRPYNPGRPENYPFLDFTSSELDDYQKKYADGGYTRGRAERWDYNRAGTVRIAYQKPSPEQNRYMWKQRLADAWLHEKCELLDSTLEFTPEQYPILYETVMSFESTAERKDRILRKLDVKNVREHLIELAARLGDEAAGLTQGRQMDDYEDGYQFGRLAQFLPSSEWEDFARKHEPSVENFLPKFKVLITIQNHTDYQLNWEFVARHLCKLRIERAYSAYDLKHRRSCQSVITEIRQTLHSAVEDGQYDSVFIQFQEELNDILDRLEQKAIEQDLWD